MRAVNLKSRISEIRLLVFTQRAARLSLRALWSGAAGYLLGWGLHVVWGWLPDRGTWFLIGILLAVVNIAGIIYPHSKYKDFMWQLDRRLGLKEQVSAAWEVVNSEETEQVQDLLLADVIRLLPQVREHIARRGWFLQRDIEASIMVLILYIIMVLITLSSLPELPQAKADLLPPLGEDPTAAEIFPSGIPGLSPSDTAQLGDLQGGDQGESFPVRNPRLAHRCLACHSCLPFPLGSSRCAGPPARCSSRARRRRSAR